LRESFITGKQCRTLSAGIRSAAGEILIARAAGRKLRTRAIGRALRGLLLRKNRIVILTECLYDSLRFFDGFPPDFSIPPAGFLPEAETFRARWLGLDVRLIAWLFIIVRHIRPFSQRIFGRWQRNGLGILCGGENA